MDLAAIADALAGRYAPGVVTPPTGFKNITGSTAKPPNGIPNTPYVIVWPTEGDITYIPGAVKGEHEFQITFYYSKAEGDIPREYHALEHWLGVLLGQLHAQMQLALATYVMKALVIKWEIAMHVYAGVQYEGITLTVHVWTSEAVTLVP